MSATQPSGLGKYEIRGTLGKGAMGTVYDGRDPVIDRRVAIKTVALPDVQDEEAVEGLARFKREAQAAGRLTHPNIVGVFDYGETDDVAYIVMEFVEGRSLKEVLSAGERMAVPDIVTLMEDVLAGLTYSHSRGVVHRDIKPANIMLTKEGQAKIADFGIARIEASSMTQVGTVMGTPAYMSPEQFMGQVVDQRTDIYSCGVMLYQLLTGDRPFEGSMTAIMHKAMTTTPPKPSELAVTSPASLDGVVARAMSRRPEDRYGSAAEFAQALRTVPAEAEALPWDEAPVGDETIVGKPTQPVRLSPVAPPSTTAPVSARASATAVPKRNSKIPVLAGGGVAFVAVAGAALWFLLPGATPTPPAPAPSQVASVTSPAVVSPPPPAAQVQPPAAGPTASPLAQSSPPTASPTTASPPTASPAAVAPPVVAPPAAVTPASPPLPPAVYTPPATATPASIMPQQAPPPASQPVQPTPQAAERVPATPPSPPLPPAVAIPASVAPEPARPAPRLPAAVLTALAGTLPNVRCSLSHAAIGADGAVLLTGVSGKGRPEEDLQRAASAADPAGVAAQIQTFDGPYCPALDIIRPLADPAGRNGLDLVQAGGTASLHDNEVIALHVTMPGFAGYLQVAYLQHDATVSPLVPGPGYPAQTFPAREPIDLGKPRSDFEGWHVGPPFGTDMIVAVASTAPLFSRPLPDTQPLASYLSTLQSAIEALRRRGGSVAAAALVLDTRPNP